MSNVESTANGFSVSYRNEFPVFIRPWPHSDPMAFSQVILEKEYFPLTDYIISNMLVDRGEIRIIDAGANVGYASLFILLELPGAKIACIEPGETNVTNLKRNLAEFIRRGKVYVYQNALLDRSGLDVVIDNSFRDGREWSTSVKLSDSRENLKSVTVPQVMKEMGWDYLTALKIDIEGSERFVFGPDSDLSYLSKILIVCLEIHDEFNCRQEIYARLRNQDFTLFNAGETTFALNNRFITRNV